MGPAILLGKPPPARFISRLLGLLGAVPRADGVLALDEPPRANGTSLELVATDQVTLGTLLASRVLHRENPLSSPPLPKVYWRQ